MKIGVFKILFLSICFAILEFIKSHIFAFYVRFNIIIVATVVLASLFGVCFINIVVLYKDLIYFYKRLCVSLVFKNFSNRVFISTYFISIGCFYEQS